MKYIILALLVALNVNGQKNMTNTFFTWNKFTDYFGREMTIAEDVFAGMVKSGLKTIALLKWILLLYLIKRKT